MMWAARLYGPGDVRVERIAIPRPMPGEVLVEVERVGLCGSDVEEYLNAPVCSPVDRDGRIIPITLGHEIVGRVAECPGGELPIGAPVIPDVVVGCGRCPWCLRHEEGLCPGLRVRGQHQDGGLARWMIASAATCVVVPDHVPPESAVFAEPLAVAVRALRKAPDLAGATVLVYGAGTIGQLVVQLATASPARRVIAVDPVAERRDLASARGAVAVHPSEATPAVADVVIECSGVPDAPGEAVRLCRPGGTVVLVGFRRGELTVPWLDVVLGERRLLGSAAHVWDEDTAAAVALLARGVVDPAPLHERTLPLTEVAAALRRPTGFKTLIDPSGDMP
ncbi:zinc-dependent alcohol dehydrogenase [Streptosporangium sp. CA-135522]|uniref:zinc-dependent alcohol dehydrogenase n=1 Tax=Streptosporangium sp. CA-135522 TaxID=3240072 RepID=UPI003D8E0131